MISQRILVVEDNPANRDLMTYLLGAFGYQVSAADDGPSGVSAALRERPDLIICDIHLPDFDGYEVARRLKADETTRKIPLVAVTALAMVGDRDRVLAGGFDAYIAKPIDPETFVPEVERLLRRGQPLTPGPQTGNTAPVPQADRNGIRILVMDDSRVNNELTRSILEPLGYNVILAGDPAEAMELARAHRPQLIISDVHMAGPGGYDLLQALRAEPEFRNIAFVFLSSTCRRQRDIDSGLALGASRFLLRPIEPQALIQVVEDCLRACQEDSNGHHTGSR